MEEDEDEFEALDGRLNQDDFDDEKSEHEPQLSARENALLIDNRGMGGN